MNDFYQRIKCNLNVPNLLSFLRVLLIVPFTIYFLKDEYIMAAVMLAISGISDMFDGMIARKFNQITSLGMMLDPVADKLTLAAVVLCIGMKFTVVLPVVVLLVLKELSMLIAGAILLKKHKKPPMAQWYGKLGTITFYVSVSIIVALKAIWGIQNIGLTISLMCITAIAMFYALARYFLIFIDLCKDNTEKDIDLIKSSVILDGDTNKI